MKYERTSFHSFSLSRSAEWSGVPVAPDTPLSARQPVRVPLPPGEPLDLRHTLQSGQVFRWGRQGDTWYGPFGQTSLAVRACGDFLEMRAQGHPLTAGEAWSFLGLEISLRQVYRRFEADAWLAAAIAATPGLRILRQDPWECTANFICSQNSNIPKIQRSTELLAREWGTVHRWDGGIEVACFPTPEVLASVPAADLRRAGVGYRAEYLAATARRVASREIDLPALRRLPYPEALTALLTLPGIGRKVADCILLFALDQPQAFPVDVWVRRVVHELYPRALRRTLPDIADRIARPLSVREYEALVQFAWARWGRLAGYAQQYLFHARRLGLIGPGRTVERGGANGAVGLE